LIEKVRERRAASTVWQLPALDFHHPYRHTHKNTQTHTDTHTDTDTHNVGPYS